MSIGATRIHDVMPQSEDGNWEIKDVMLKLKAMGTMMRYLEVILSGIVGCNEIEDGWLHECLTYIEDNLLSLRKDVLENGIMSCSILGNQARMESMIELCLQLLNSQNQLLNSQNERIRGLETAVERLETGMNEILRLLRNQQQ
jgi:hypothetical protein